MSGKLEALLQCGQQVSTPNEVVVLRDVRPALRVVRECEAMLLGYQCRHQKMRR